MSESLGKLHDKTFEAILLLYVNHGSRCLEGNEKKSITEFLTNESESRGYRSYMEAYRKIHVPKPQTVRGENIIK